MAQARTACVAGCHSWLLASRCRRSLLGVLRCAWRVSGQGRGSAPKPPPSVEEVRMWRGSQAWLAGAAAAVGAYVVLGGHYFTISAVEDDGELDDDDDDDVEVEAAD